MAEGSGSWALKLSDLPKYCADEGAAWELVERLRWHGKPHCPHCGNAERVYFLAPREGVRRTARGNASYRRLWKCGAKGCRKQFSVLVGTVFEDSRVPLSKWLLALFLLCAGKNGVSAHELHRQLGVSYKTAWFMLHRLRYAMERSPAAGRLGGVIEADETWVGGRARVGQDGEQRPSTKAPVMTLVQRGDPGEVRSVVVADVTGKSLAGVIRDNVDPSRSFLMTDGAQAYREVGQEFLGHGRVDHSAFEYVRGYNHVNTAEAYFSQLKRSIDGTYHHVSREHLHRYLAEFDFRYNTRKTTDGARAERLIEQAEGRRLHYRDTQ